VREIQLDHVRLSALTWGEQGPLAVLLHGFPDTAYTWRHLGPSLAEDGFRVVAPYTRGYAPSDCPADGRTDVGALMADAVGVHAALGAGDDAVLVGHDWGAVTAGALAAHRDSPYARVVTMAVPPIAAMRRASARHLPGQARRSWYIGFNQLPLLPERSLDRLVPKLWRDWSPGYDASEDVPRVLEALATPEHRRAAIGYYRQAARPWGIPARYRRWQGALTRAPIVPTLHLHGRDDGCLSPALAEHVEEVLPAGSAAHVVADAGHFLHLEQPDQVGALVRAFLAAG
jgi:pimeloyl-ACP methyl ester carboxylesterase